MRKKRFGVFLTGVMLLAFAGCGQQEAETSSVVLVQEEDTAAYPTTTVEYGEVVRTVAIDCSYTSTEKQQLSFPVEGRLITYVGVKQGDYVEKGQLLAALDVEDLEVEIEELEYQISLQELNLTQTQEMKDHELANAQLWYEGYTFKTQSDKDDLKEQKEDIELRYKTGLEDIADNLTLLRKRLNRYEKELKDGRLFAGMAGQITYLDKEMEGGYSEKDFQVITISNLDSCYFVTNKMEYKDYLAAEGTIDIVYNADGKECISQAEPVLLEDWTEQMYFKHTGTELIENGTQGTITLELGRKQDVLCLPKNALHESDNGPFVYLEKDGLLEMRYVTVGLEGDTATEITSGLEQGEIIALKK